MRGSGALPEEELVGALKLSSGEGPLGDFVGVFVVQSGPVSEAEDCDSGEDADEEDDVEADEVLEELSDESELDRVFVRRVANSAHSEQNSPGCEVTPTMHLSW